MRSRAASRITGPMSVARGLRVGEGAVPATEMGPVIPDAARERIADYVDRGLEEGARLVCDGRPGVPQAGYFIRPTIFDHVRPQMSIAREEIFGPLLSIVRASDLNAAL